MYTVVIGILSSAQPRAVQHRPFTAVISSRRWLCACSWHPIFSLQLLSPPGFLSHSHPASHRSALALGSSGAGQTLPHQLGMRSTAANSCCTRTDMPACGGKPGTSGFIKDIKHPSGRTDLVIRTRPSLGHPFAPLCLADLLHWRGGTAQNHATCAAPGCHGDRPATSPVKAERWWHCTGLPLKKYLCTSKAKPSVFHLTQTQLSRTPAFVLCTGSFFLVSTLRADMLRCAFVRELEDMTARTTASSASSTQPLVYTLPMLRQPHQAMRPQLGTSTRTTLSQDAWCLLSFDSSPFWRMWGVHPFFSVSCIQRTWGFMSVRPRAVFGKSPSQVSLDHFCSQVSHGLGCMVVQEPQGWEH